MLFLHGFCYAGRKKEKKKMALTLFGFQGRKEEKEMGP